MATTILPAERDPMGAAIYDYFNHHKADRLRVFSSQFEEDEIPVKELFRTIQSMPAFEIIKVGKMRVKRKAQKNTAIQLYFKHLQLD